MNVPEFQRVIHSAMNFTRDSDAILTLGMKPTRPETGYGYIETDLRASSATNKEVFRVDSFKEKPDAETALRYIEQNNYFWNAGIFVWNISTIVNAFRVYCPAIAKIFENVRPYFYTEKEQEVIDREFPNCETYRWTTPSWKRRKRFLSFPQTSAGAIWVHGVPCMNRCPRT